MADLTPFDAFQIEEYKNISNSHFESIKQVSLFFRYYLLILAAPVIIINLLSVGKDTNNVDKFLTNGLSPIYYNIVFGYFLIVSLIGFLIYLYVINLRLDAVLYARAVNKVRRYFYEKSDLIIQQFDSYLGLPIVSTRPRYKEKTFFAPLLFIFSIINCGFLYSAFILKMINAEYFGYWSLPIDLKINNIFIVITLIIYFSLHVFAYYTLIHLRNNYYLKDYKIGIDIDGVINNQTEHFINFIEKLTGKKIDKNLIKEIPVHLNKELGISYDDERIVFNTKEYWEQLSFKTEAIKRINDFEKRFGLEIVFFTYRDWPQYKNLEDYKKFEQKIKNAGYNALKYSKNKKEISNITNEWINKENEIKIRGFTTNGFKGKILNVRSKFEKSYKKIVMEIGNPYISNTRFTNRFRGLILNNNRFQRVSIKGFKYFIEDTPENAIRLSSFCDYVFMFNEPYNQSDRYIFPKNVIRVNSWNDIYSHIKLFS